MPICRKQCPVLVDRVSRPLAWLCVCALLGGCSDTGAPADQVGELVRVDGEGLREGLEVILSVVQYVAEGGAVSILSILEVSP
ncbi:MAG: hypothetical protein D8M59_11740 [Planctomycetes bacterium]|nr:hypothetical protein [Planctomycetota bacterium]